MLVTVLDTTELVNARRREAERVQLKEALQAKRIELLEEVFRTAPRSCTCCVARISFSNSPMMRITSLSAGAN